MSIKISILGSTGSIGESALKVVKNLRGEIEVVGLAAGKNIKRLEEQIKEFSPKAVSVESEEDAKILKRKFKGISVYFGEMGNVEIASLSEAKVVLSAIVGIAGLSSTLKAIKLGKRVALANKESLVTAGKLIKDSAKKSGAEILPVDSEHCAIFQCIKGENKKEISKIILTASGGALRDYPLDKIGEAELEDVLKHPTWKMGKKITVDSATLVNKGLEMIEASYLFDIPIDSIDVIIHRESLIHSFVEFIDGSILAQIAEPDMSLPIQYAITYPFRKKGIVKKVSFEKVKSLTFEPVEEKRYPCFKLAREAFKTSQAHTIAFNASNEVAVKHFIKGTIKFGKIYSIISEVLSKTHSYSPNTVEEIFYIDKISRDMAEELITKGF